MVPENSSIKRACSFQRLDTNILLFKASEGHSCLTTLNICGFNLAASLKPNTYIFSV
jgi:hypothetical protein